MAGNNYQFTITSGSMALLIAALAAAGGALFLGGMTFGFGRAEQRLDALERSLTARIAALPREAADTPPPPLAPTLAVRDTATGEDAAPAAPTRRTTPPAPPPDSDAALPMAAEQPPQPVEAPPQPNDTSPTAKPPGPPEPPAEPSPTPPETSAEPLTLPSPREEHAAEAAPATEPPITPAAAPPAAATLPPGAPETVGETLYEVQVGLFLGRANAQQLHDRLLRAGYAVSLFVAPGSNERTWYAVRVGRFAKRQDAAAAAARIQRTEGLSTLIARSGELN